MIRCLFQVFSLALFLGAVCGCLGPRRSDYVSAHPVSIEDPSVRADEVWDAIEETLRRNRFRLDRTDRRAGVITTMPETSQHFFEFWRHDVDTRPDFWEATLNPLRRWVEVNVTRGEEGRWTGLALVVHIERFSSYDRQFNSTGALYEYFGDTMPATTGLTPESAPQDRWLDLGRDRAMEEYLLRAIRGRAGL